MTNQEMPIFARTFDFLTWLLPATNNFPRAHRHSFTQRLLNAAFDLRERLEEEANYRKGAARLERGVRFAPRIPPGLSQFPTPAQRSGRRREIWDAPISALICQEERKKLYYIS